MTAFTPHSLIAARLLDCDFSNPYQCYLSGRTLAAGRAMAMRVVLTDARFCSAGLSACPPETDGLPGLVVGRYDDVVTIQANTTAGMDSCFLKFWRCSTRLWQLYGEKTGWFYNQHDNRAFVASWAQGLDGEGHLCALSGRVYYIRQPRPPGARMVLTIDRSAEGSCLSHSKQCP